MYQTYEFPATTKPKSTKSFQPVLQTLVSANKATPKRERPLIGKQGTLEIGADTRNNKGLRESSHDLPQKLQMDVVINTTKKNANFSGLSPVTIAATTAKTMTKIKRPQSYKKGEIMANRQP